jgi:hypothetical protein
LRNWKESEAAALGHQKEITKVLGMRSTSGLRRPSLESVSCLDVLTSFTDGTATTTTELDLHFDKIVYRPHQPVEKALGITEQELRRLAEDIWSAGLLKVASIQICSLTIKRWATEFGSVRGALGV